MKSVWAFIKRQWASFCETQENMLCPHDDFGGTCMRCWRGED